MILKIIIDNREHKLLNIINNLVNEKNELYKENIIIISEQLDIGDIQILFNDKLFIYERKTVNDLLSSINDGRYKEQKMRLLNSHATNINYIIENDNIISNLNGITNQNKLTSVYLNSIYRDNINVFFTNNINDTSILILLIASKIITNPEKFSNININYNYIDICKIKTKKSSNIDKNTCYLLQLSQIPTISKEIAKKINEKYSTLFELLTELKMNGETILTSIDGIGLKKAKTIYNYLM